MFYKHVGWNDLLKAICQNHHLYGEGPMAEQDLSDVYFTEKAPMAEHVCQISTLKRMH